MTLTTEQSTILKRILTNNRRWVLALAKRETNGDQIGTEGWCVESALRVTKQLRDLKCAKPIHDVAWPVFVDVKLSVILPKSDVYTEMHGFTLLDDIVIDLTADQFTYPWNGQIPPAIFVKHIKDFKRDEKAWWWGWKPKSPKASLQVNIGKETFNSLEDYVNNSIVKQKQDALRYETKLQIRRRLLAVRL